MSSLRWSYTSPMHPYSHTLFKIHTKNLETSRLLSFFNTKTLFVDQELCSFSSSFQDQRFWFSRVNFRFRKIFRMMMPRSRLKFIDYDPRFYAIYEWSAIRRDSDWIWRYTWSVDSRGASISWRFSSELFQRASSTKWPSLKETTRKTQFRAPSLSSGGCGGNTSAPLRYSHAVARPTARKGRSTRRTAY